MIRVHVYRNKNEQEGKLMVVENTFEEFKEKICNIFEISQQNVKLFTPNGCEINDIRVLRDNEKIYLCSKGSTIETLENSMSKSNLNDDKHSHDSKSEWITLNVGGKLFTTTRTTILVKESDSMLARMFSDDNIHLMNPSARDASGAYLIDRSPEYFEPILNYLRHGEVILDKNINPKGVLEEAVFYGNYYHS